MEPMIISSMSSIRRALADRISFRRYRYLAENRRRLGSRLYKAKLTAENPVDTVQSIEHALRGLDKAVAEEQERAARALGITAPDEIEKFVARTHHDVMDRI